MPFCTPISRLAWQVGKQYAAKGARAGSKKDAVAVAEDGFVALEALFGGGAAAVDDLVAVARALRRLPLVDPFLPTVPPPLSPFPGHHGPISSKG